LDKDSEIEIPFGMWIRMTYNGAHLHWLKALPQGREVKPNETLRLVME
jgi:hypothetical protein